LLSRFQQNDHRNAICFDNVACETDDSNTQLWVVMSMVYFKGKSEAEVVFSFISFLFFFFWHKLSQWIAKGFACCHKKT